MSLTKKQFAKIFDKVLLRNENARGIQYAIEKSISPFPNFNLLFELIWHLLALTFSQVRTHSKLQCFGKIWPKLSEAIKNLLKIFMFVCCCFFFLLTLLTDLFLIKKTYFFWHGVSIPNQASKLFVPFITLLLLSIYTSIWHKIPFTSAWRIGFFFDNISFFIITTPSL